MYGDGFTRRSTRYTANGSTGSTRSKRCASTTWKMSPSRMCSFAASTAAVHSAPVRLVRTSGSSLSSSGGGSDGVYGNGRPSSVDRVGELARPRCRSTCARSRRRSPARGRRSRSGSSAGGSGRTRPPGRPVSTRRRATRDRRWGRSAGARSRAPCRSPSSRRCPRGTAAACLLGRAVSLQQRVERAPAFPRRREFRPAGCRRSIRGGDRAPRR